MTEQPKEQVIRLFAKRPDIQPRSRIGDRLGHYQKLRWLTVWLTQLVFYGVPWLTWDNRQAVLFDLVKRKFYLFGWVLWPQDVIYLALLLIICAIGLFVVTAIAGRVWCGFGCPQTVYSEIFMYVERVIEGDRAQRLARNRNRYSVDTMSRKFAKHAVWLLIAFWTGITFVGFFTPIRQLLLQIASLNLSHWESFWVLFYSAATYGNAGFLREQVCKYMCPYARFQSAMFDRNTLIVTYDEKRGEPRGVGLNERKERGLGECVDCGLCVQVCPVGIDIRKGLQYECIGCGACVDACTYVFDKMGTGAPTLISYSTQTYMETVPAERKPASWKTYFLRKKVLAYLILLCGFSGGLATAMLTRIPLKVDIMRDRGVLAREVQGQYIENVYRIQIMNADEHRHTYRLAVDGMPGIELSSQNHIELAGEDLRLMPLRLRIPEVSAEQGVHKVYIHISVDDKPNWTIAEKTSFIVPKNLVSN